MNYLDYYFSNNLDGASLERASQVPVGVDPRAPLKAGTQPGMMYPSGTMTRKEEGGGGDTGGAGGSTGGGSDTGEGGPGAAAGSGSGGHGGDTGGLGAGNTGGGDPYPPGAGGPGTSTTVTPPPAATEQFPGTLDPNQKVTGQIDEFTKFLKEIGADQYKFWQENYKPLEEQQIAETKRFMTPEFANQQATQAGADVTGAFAGKRAATEADLQSMGLGDPSQGRYQAYRRGLDIAEAGTLASAKTGARRNAEMFGYQALTGLVGQGNAKTAAAVGTTGAAAGLASTAAGLQQRQNEFANTFNQRNYEFGKTLDFEKWKAENAADSAESAGFGTAAGTIVGGLIGAYFGGPAGAAAGASAGGSVGKNISSKALKTNKRPFRGGLAALDKMPVEQWKYKKGVADEGHHIGPYAEDFKRATGKGDGKSIAHQDAIGVTMAAVKELHDRVRTLEAKRGGKAATRNQGASEERQEPKLAPRAEAREETREKKLRPHVSDSSSYLNQPEGAEA